MKQKRVHPNHPNPTSYGPEIVTTLWQVAFKIIFNSKSMQPGWKKHKTACANNAHRTTFIVLGSYMSMRVVRSMTILIQSIF